MSSGRYQWFCVRTPDGKTGYVRSDCAVPCDLNGNQVTVTPTPAPTTTTSISTYGYIQITKPSTNLRRTIGGETIHQLANESVWPLIGTVITRMV